MLMSCCVYTVSATRNTAFCGAEAKRTCQISKGSHTFPFSLIRKYLINASFRANA